MSSTIEGCDVWAREDELDLGQEDEAAANGIIDHGGLSMGGDPMVNGEEESLVLDGPDAPGTEKQSPRTNESPQVLAGAFGSPDETASTPDDTPSLHVSLCHFCTDIC